MAKYKVKKTPLMDYKTKKPLNVGDVIERNVKDVESFEKRFGKDYLERVEENEEKKETTKKEPPKKKK